MQVKRDNSRTAYHDRVNPQVVKTEHPFNHAQFGLFKNPGLGSLGKQDLYLILGYRGFGSIMDPQDPEYYIG